MYFDRTSIGPINNFHLKLASILFMVNFNKIQYHFIVGMSGVVVVQVLTLVVIFFAKRGLVGSLMISGAVRALIHLNSGLRAGRAFAVSAVTLFN